MATTKKHSISSSSQSTSATTTKKPRTRTRQPPVVERAVAGSSGTAAPAAPASPAAGSASSGSAGAAIDAPPQVTIPAVPAGFVPANPADLRGFRALASQVAAIPGAIAELQGFANYTTVFGITAPDVTQLTQRLSVGSEWTTLLSQTAAWYNYTKSQQGTAWKDAMLLLDTLKSPFDLASTANPALLSQYPAIARLLGAKTVVAKRAASSRARNKKAEAAQTATGASAGSVSTGTSTQAPAPAPAATGTATATTTQGGTANGAAAPAAATPRVVASPAS